MGQQHSSSSFPGHSSVHQVQEYLERQLACWRWRADPVHNRHIPRVVFQTSTNQQAQLHLNELLARKGGRTQPLTIEDISQLSRRLQETAPQEYIIFEEYAVTLEGLRGRLDMGQCLMVLEEGLWGYEEVLAWLGECVVDLQCCFVTEKGEVRAWVNPNHKCNEPSERHIRLNRENAVVRSLIEEVQALCTSQQDYAHFAAQIRHQRLTDALETGTFSWTRRFLHSYAYHHGITLPNKLPSLAPNVASLPPSPLKPQQESPVDITLHSSQSTTRLSLHQTAELSPLKQPFSFTKPKHQSAQSRSFTVEPTTPQPTPACTVRESLPMSVDQVELPSHMISLPNRRHTTQQLTPPVKERRKAVSIFAATVPSLETRQSKDSTKEANKTSILRHNKSQFMRTYQIEETSSFGEAAQSHCSSEEEHKARHWTNTPPAEHKHCFRAPPRQGNSLMVGRGETTQKMIHSKENKGVNGLRRQTAGDFRELLGGRTISNLFDESVGREQVSRGSLQSGVESAYEGTLSHMARSVTLLNTSKTNIPTGQGEAFPR